MEELRVQISKRKATHTFSTYARTGEQLKNFSLPIKKYKKENAIIYRGAPAESEGIEYLNVEDYLKSLS